MILKKLLQIKKKRLDKYEQTQPIAFIMDGNGRWKKTKVETGHLKGVEIVKNSCKFNKT